MRISGPSVRRRTRIEIIPLIDVVFFLLATFVMVSLSMVKNQGIPLRLPRAASGLPQERARAVTISLTEQGELYLNKALVRREELEQQLRHLKDAEPELSVFINGDVGASFGSAIEVLDLVRTLDISTVSIQTARQGSR